MRRVFAWLDAHVGAIQGLSAIATALLAIGALIGVKVQIDASERIQREQSARDIYREYLNLSIGRPEFSAPDYCAILDSPQEVAYENYVEYTLYTAEQAMAADAGWEPVFAATLKSHSAYLCSVTDWSDYSTEVQDLVANFRADNCRKPAPCPVKQDASEQ